MKSIRCIICGKVNGCQTIAEVKQCDNNPVTEPKVIIIKSKM